MSPSLRPDECPADVECQKCGETWEIQSNSKWTFSADIGDDPETKRHDPTLPKYDVPTSKRRRYIVFCPCGRRLVDILDPDWPGGASGGYQG